MGGGTDPQIVNRCTERRAEVSYSPNRFVSGETVAGTDWTGGSVGHRIDVDISEIIELL